MLVLISGSIISIAVANWEKKDARKEIHALTDAIIEKGFSISKDFTLKTFLYLHSKDIKFKVTNFSKSNAREFEEEWAKIRDSILSAFDLVKSFGFIDATLTSKNAVIPIVYYLYHRGIYTGFESRTEYADDRATIKKWLHTALVKRLFGATTDSVLSQIRRAFTYDVTECPISSDLKIFPTTEINSEIRKDTGISDEFIEELLLTQKEDKYSFSILALLYPGKDYKNNSFHMDHLHPECMFDELPELSNYAKNWQIYNSIKNLQMLDANDNMSKNGESLFDWVARQANTPDKRTAFLQAHLIPDVDLGINNFNQFIEERGSLLHKKLKEVLF